MTALRVDRGARHRACPLAFHPALAHVRTRDVTPWPHAHTAEIATIALVRAISPAGTRTFIGIVTVERAAIAAGMAALGRGIATRLTVVEAHRPTCRAEVVASELAIVGVTGEEALTFLMRARAHATGAAVITGPRVTTGG